MAKKTGRQILKDFFAIPKADKEAVYGIPSCFTSAVSEYSLIGPSCGITNRQMQDMGNWLERTIYAKG